MLYRTSLLICDLAPQYTVVRHSCFEFPGFQVSEFLRSGFWVYQLVGRSKEDKAGSGMDTACRQVDTYEALEHFFCPFRHLDHFKKGFLGPYEFAQQLQQKYGVEVAPSQALDLFFAMVRNPKTLNPKTPNP